MNTFTRGVRNAFRNVVRTGSIVIILSISIGLVIAMLAARQVIKRNINEVEKIQGLAESLLVLSQAENESITKERVSLTEAIQDIQETFHDAASEKGVQIQLNIPELDVWANEAVLRQVITILLDNAVKYSPKGSKVVVDAEARKHKVTLKIQDQGCGIDTKDKPYIFDRFYRADKSRTRTDISGHGLGLSIAKSLSDAHGFDLRLVSSSAKKGTVFSLAIPR